MIIPPDNAIGDVSINPYEQNFKGFNLYKVKRNMTRIIRIILREGLYLRREKDVIPISVAYVAKTGASGYRLCR